MKKLENNDAMLDRITLIATLYYKDKLSQQEIAKKLNISRPWVSKLLTRAEELGIVKIEIESPILGNTQLEQQLCDKYQLEYASVIDNSDTSKDYLSMAAVNYFISQIKPTDVIGVAWGNAVSRFIRHIHPLKFSDIQIVPLAGSFGASFDTLPNYNVIQLANLTGGKSHLLHFPAFCSSKEEYETLSSNPKVQSTLNLAENPDIIITGIGTFETSFLTRHDILSADEVAQLKDAGAIGDISLQFLTSDSKLVETELTERIIHADIFKASKHARVSIGIAEGTYKKDIIHSALSLHLINSFLLPKKQRLLCLTDSIQRLFRCFFLFYFYFFSHFCVIFTDILSKKRKLIKI